MTHAKAFALAAVVAGSLGWGMSAQAAPLSPAPLGVSEGALVERTGGGCGLGFHPNPWGICRPNLYGPRPYWGRPVYGGYGYYRPRPVYGPYGYYRPRPVYGPYGYYRPRPVYGPRPFY